MRLRDEIFVADFSSRALLKSSQRSSVRSQFSQFPLSPRAGIPLKVEEEKARAEGARGYLPKSLDWERLVSAIRIAAKDGDFIADDFDEPKVGPLSRREIDVLTYIAQGKTHEEIGIIGGISAETVRTHMKSILRKLDCANAPAAVSRAYELGILRA